MQEPKRPFSIHDEEKLCRRRLVDAADWDKCGGLFHAFGLFLYHGNHRKRLRLSQQKPETELSELPSLLLVILHSQFTSAIRVFFTFTRR